MGEDLPLQISRLGLVPYKETWDLQKTLQRALIDGTGEDTLLLCEHPPTITLGRSTATDSLIASKEELEQLGVELYEIERGGDITYHGPGQLVAYPIIDLRRKKTDVGWYMRALEEIILKTLQHFEIIGNQISGKTGVWTLSAENDKKNAPRKLASIGIRLSRWCTLHGLSLNVRDCSSGFGLIHPCGFHDVAMTSMEGELALLHGKEDQYPSLKMTEVQEALIDAFCDILKYRRNP